jgi:hypothetical protein
MIPDSYERRIKGLCAVCLQKVAIVPTFTRKDKLSYWPRLSYSTSASPSCYFHN